MDQRQSQFTEVQSLESSDYLPSFGANTNKKISRDNFFNQIRELVDFIYPTIESLKQADLPADPDDPVYVIVEETGFVIYKITSLAPQAGDIELNNGTTASLLSASITGSMFDTVADLAAANLPVGDVAYTKGCLSIGDLGHGFFTIASPSGTPNGYSRILLANGNHAILLETNGVYNTRQFGGDIIAAINAVKGNKKTLKIIGTVNVAAGTQIVIDLPISIIGDGPNSSKLVFTGSPTKVKRTYQIWKAAYDTADYSSSDDAEIACGFILQPNAAGSSLSGFEIEAYWDQSINYPLPFNSATDYPTSNYDYAILCQASNVEIERVKTSGPWGQSGLTGGLCIDITQPSGAVENVQVTDCEIYGRYGLILLGPHGSGAAPNYADMVFDDVRGAGGLSDFQCYGTQFYDTQLRLRIDGSNRRVKRFPFGGGGGALWIDGQISRNSAKRQQHIRFTNCRFVNVDDYTFYINFINRVEFVMCHTEFRGGSYLEDAVTPNSASFMYGRMITKNARAINLIGGDRSGEPDNIVWSDSGVQIVTEIGVSDGLGSAVGRTFSGGALRARKAWTPSVKIGGIALTTGVSISIGTVAKDKDLVYGTFRIDVTNNEGRTGALTIEDLPYTISERFSTSSSDGSTVFHTLSNVTFGGFLGGNLDEGTKIMQLIKNTSGAASGTVGHADLTVPWSIRGSFTYVTDEPDVI
jgi:hypothetical protein